MSVVLNPATEEPLAELESASAQETDEAEARAKAAFPAWRAVAPTDRARLLRRLATLVEEHHEELSRIESRNVGKPIAGARAVFRGAAPEGRGFWYPATLVEATADDRIAREEVFGPEYGLSGSVWTRDGGRALRVARAIETGVLSINSNSSVRPSTPFGGFKQSGFGRELGMHAMEGYSEVKNVFYSTEG